MPDWSYRTILRPLLFQLPAAAARDVCLGVTGTLARSPGGVRVIELLGHMRPPRALERRHLGLVFPAPVGLAGVLDPAACATQALARFGVGFLEIGPVTLRALASGGRLEVDVARDVMRVPEPVGNPGVDVVVAHLTRAPRVNVPLLARLDVAPGAGAAPATDECARLMSALAPHVDAFALATAGCSDWSAEERRTHIHDVVRAARTVRPLRPLLAVVAADVEPAVVDGIVETAAAAGLDGVVVDGSLTVPAPHRERGATVRERALGVVARIRRTRNGLVIVAGGGVHEPEDALRLMEAGADLVLVDSGLALTGPGLPKRINDAVLHAESAGPSAEEPAVAGEGAQPMQRSWFWTLLMGTGMLIGSVIALAIAASRVVLPYDEQFVGLSRAQLAAANAHLLAFMSHDRVTLAGTMISIGVLYVGLSFHGIRRGEHWAHLAVLSSALAGFASFFLFLGFGYFDPFHAFVTGLLFQLFVMGVHCPLGERRSVTLPGLRNDRRWLLSQWGQLGLIAHAVALAVAGLVISTVGITHVFVPEDLEFMQTTREALAAIGPHLIPLVAHDRASFGGMLVVSGMTFLMASLWGFRRGEAWLWWTMLVAGVPAYMCAIGVHYAVGYHNEFHLAPAFAGLALFLGAMALSYPYLCGADPGLAQAWGTRRERRRAT
jgi:dihydroorotate dehydrogenase